jgi:hypothetical protein
MKRSTFFIIESSAFGQTVVVVDRLPVGAHRGSAHWDILVGSRCYVGGGFYVVIIVLAQVLLQDVQQLWNNSYLPPKIVLSNKLQ